MRRNPLVAVLALWAAFTACLTIAPVPAYAQINPPHPSGGVAVEVDPIATPLANTAIDGMEDGSGVTNAGAFRTALALGTAALLATGTTNGTIPVLGASGLPAIGASLLTGITAAQVGAQSVDATLTAVAAWAWTSGTEVKTLTAADTFGTINVGTAANNIVQLNGSAQLPAVSGALLTNLSGGVTQKTITVTTGAITAPNSVDVEVPDAYTQGVIDLFVATVDCAGASCAVEVTLYDGDPDAIPAVPQIADVWGVVTAGSFHTFTDNIATAGPVITAGFAVLAPSVAYRRTNSLYLRAKANDNVTQMTISVYNRERP